MAYEEREVFRLVREQMAVSELHQVDAKKQIGEHSVNGTLFCLRHAKTAMTNAIDTLAAIEKEDKDKEPG